MVNMSPAQIESFFQTPRYAVFGTNSTGGHPQLTTVWFLYEEGFAYIGIERSSIKYRNIGSAEVLETGQATDDILWRLTRRYHDSDKDTHQYQESVKELDLVLVKVIPQKIVAMDYSSD